MRLGESIDKESFEPGIETQIAITVINAFSSGIGCDETDITIADNPTFFRTGLDGVACQSTTVLLINIDVVNAINTPANISEGQVYPFLINAQCWEQVHTAPPNPSSGLNTIIWYINVLEGDTIWISGRNNYLVRNLDSGNTWSDNLSPSNNDNSTIYCVWFMTSPKGVIGIRNEGIYRTDNNGQNWELATLFDQQAPHNEPYNFLFYGFGR